MKLAADDRLKAGVRAPLRHPAFRWLLLGRTINLVGSAIAPIALAFAVLDLHGSATDLGLVVASRSLMSVLLLLYGGVLADRLPRRVLLVGAAGAAAVTQAAVAVLVLSGTAAIWTLALLSAVNGAVSGLGMPASLSVLPQTVPADQFTTANALTRLVSNSTNILGLSFGGALVAVAGPGWGIAVDAGTFAAAAICFSRLPIQPSQAGPRRSVVADLREGWQEFFSRTWVWAVVAQFLVLNAALAGAEGVLGPVVADRTIGRSAYGVVLASSAVGLLVGALVALKYQPRRALRFGVAVMLATALPSLSLALQPTIAALCVAFFVSGAVLDQFGVAWDTSLQQNIPPERLSRVYSYDALGSFLAIPIGQTVVGPIAAAAGVRATLIGLAAAIAVATLLALSSRSVWTLERDA